MTILITLAVVAGLLIAGLRYPGALLAGSFITYQAGALLKFPPVVIIYTAAAAAIAIARHFVLRGRFRLRFLDIMSLLVLLVCAVSLFWSVDEELSLAMLTQLALSFAGMYAIGRLHSGDPAPLLRQMCLFLAGSGALLGLCLLAERASGSFTAEHRLIVTGSDAQAVGLSQPWPAMLLACVVLLLNGRGWARLVGLTCLPVIAYVAVSAATRSVFLAFGVGALVYIAASLSIRNLPRVLFGVLGIVAAGFAAIFVMPAQQLATTVGRFDGLFSSGNGVTDASTQDRLDLYEACWQILNSYPLFGIGYGGFGKFAEQNYPHNLFLEMLVSVGAIGFIPFLVWLAVLLTGQMALLFRDHAAGAIIFAMTILTLAQYQISFAFSMAKPLFLMAALTACFGPIARWSPVRRGRPQTPVHAEQAAPR